MELERLFYGALPRPLKFNVSDLTVTHFITTEHVDRGMPPDIVHADGMVPSVNGVRMFWMHGYDLMRDYKPLGKPKSMGIDTFKGEKGIAVESQFYQPSIPQAVDGFPALCFDWVIQDILNAWSIGWQSRKSEMRPEKMADGQEVPVRHVLDWELYEYSLVGIPMNPYAMGKALESARKSGRVTCDQLHDWGLDVKCIGCEKCPKHNSAPPSADGKGGLITRLGKSLQVERESGFGGFLKRVASEVTNQGVTK